MQRRTHSHLSPRAAYSVEQAKRQGLDDVARTFYPLKNSPDVQSGSLTLAEALAERASAAAARENTPEAARLRCLAEAADYLIADVTYSSVKTRIDVAYAAGEHPAPGLEANYNTALNTLLSGNEAVKEFLLTHPDTSVDYLSSMMWTAGCILADDEFGVKLDEIADASFLESRIRGMRGELSFESILARFDDIIVRDTPADTHSRREADKKGIDYTIDVFIQPIDQLFTLDLDVKNNPEYTFDEYGDLIPGKIWNQCNNIDYTDNRIQLEPGKIMQKTIPMQTAIINQLLLFHGKAVREKCREMNIGIEDLFID